MKKKLIVLLLVLAVLVTAPIPTYARESSVTRIAYNGNGDPEYVGTAAQNTATSAASWAIMRITYSGSNAIVIEWANGNRKQINIWNDRASLDYR